MGVRFTIVLQSLGSVAALTSLAFWPPRSGAMLIAPLGGDMASSVEVALAAPARLIGRGPFPGSLVVIGDRAAIEASAAGHGIVVLAAPAAACGRLDA